MPGPKPVCIYTQDSRPSIPLSPIHPPLARPSPPRSSISLPSPVLRSLQLHDYNRLMVDRQADVIEWCRPSAFRFHCRNTPQYRSAYTRTIGGKSTICASCCRLLDLPATRDTNTRAFRLLIL
ncbi:hypothetical protein AB1N83_014144 [Pleurotus pulmonarius]